MPMTWNDRADVRLFINVLKIHAVKLDYPALAKAMGPDCTPKAIMHRVTKLRSIAAEAEKGPNGNGAAANSSTAKPRGAKANGEAAGGKGRVRKRAAKEVEVERDDDEIGDGEDGHVKIEIEADGEPDGKRVKAESAEGGDEVPEVVEDDE